MVDISSQNNKINVTVSSSGNTANTNVTPDTAMYYSNKSKEWAISNRIVDNTDYSSKYYANESKKQADISTAKAKEVVESGNTAVSNIGSARDNAITDIINRENVSVENVNAAGSTQVANVNSAGTTQVNLAKEQVTLATNQANVAKEQATIATNKTNEVVASGNTALSNIDTAKNGAITDITNLKNTSVSNITTAKNNAITSITTQENTSKNNVITTGNEQVERVNLTGVDNRTPIFTKSEIGTNEGVYNNVYDLKHSTFDKSKFTVVGNPTITDDGIASGFSSSDYLKHSIITTGNSVKIKIRIKTSTLDDNVHYVLRGTAGDLPSDAGAMGLLISNTNKLWLVGYTSKGVYTNVGNYIINADKEYLIEAEYTSSKITYKVNNTDVATISGSYKLPKTFSLGNSFGSDSFTGSIDLKQFSITVDGKEVFNGNKTGLDVINGIEIPYTLSKTGSKIVDVAYRDRVIDLYEQEGQAGYYTIDEENKNFTLPMGEIYGMIEQKADKNEVAPLKTSYIVDTYVNGTSWYRVWSDGWCEQGGYITGNGDTSGNTRQQITFIKTFKDVNYYANGSSMTGGVSHNYIQWCSEEKRTKNSVTYYGSVNRYWYACGYIA